MMIPSVETLEHQAVHVVGGIEGKSSLSPVEQMKLRVKAGTAPSVDGELAKLLEEIENRDDSTLVLPSEFSA